MWQLWADPRQLERWWGPPTYPATVVEHDLAPGGAVTYFMTGPEGERYGGWWRVTAVEPAEVAGVHRRIRRPARDAGRRNANHHRADELTEHDGGTRMELRSTFDSREQMDQVIGMGAVEGMTAALSQIDALLSA